MFPIIKNINDIQDTINTRKEIAYREYPEYGFAQHKGYPTKKHVEALNHYGITPIHRLTFEPVKSMTQKTLFD